MIGSIEETGVIGRYDLIFIIRLIKRVTRMEAILLVCKNMGFIIIVVFVFLSIYPHHMDITVSTIDLRLTFAHRLRITRRPAAWGFRLRGARPLPKKPDRGLNNTRTRTRAHIIKA